MTKKSYNYMAQMGDDEYDDMDLVREYGLDPKVAYTPAINDAMHSEMYRRSVADYTKAGFTPAEANRSAHSAVAQSKDMANQMRKAGHIE